MVGTFTGDLKLCEKNKSKGAKGPSVAQEWPVSLPQGLVAFTVFCISLWPCLYLRIFESTASCIAPLSTVAVAWKGRPAGSGGHGSGSGVQDCGLRVICELGSVRTCC